MIIKGREGGLTCKREGDLLKDRFTVQHMLICQNAVFLPGHAVSPIKAI